MNDVRFATVEGNEAAASVAYRLSESIAIYPITPASPMGELADTWAAERRPNLWGIVPDVVQMQSEAGAAGAVHGALQAGALATTFTASQGLLLMIPNLYKIAGELTAFCMHVAARTVATHALSIFGDHSDVMAVRATGFALLASSSVQEAQDLAAVAHLATLESRIPFLHFFDGFRTSHEVQKIALLSDEDLRALVDERWIAEHRARALRPERPVLRGTAHNPDTYFQAREACNPFYLACPDVVRRTMDRFAQRTGRRYGLFDYFGDPEAEHVVVAMGSAVSVVRETVEWLRGKGHKVGVVAVRLYRPFSLPDFVRALPVSTRAVAVLDRTKEPGAPGEPLYLDVVAALREAQEEGLTRFAAPPRVVGGRYGLASKEFDPAMVAAVFSELEQERPKNHFTVGIVDDVTGTSLSVDPSLDIESEGTTRAIFYGLGSDGTVGAAKNSVKIVGERTDLYAQGYFVYDSKKAGAVTVSHLRFGPEPVLSSYLVRRANFVGCHQFEFLERIDVLAAAAEGAVFLLNAPYGPDEVWDRLPREVQEETVGKKLRFFVVDAYRVAREAGLGGRINTIMQVCFFALTRLLPREEAVARIKEAIENTYGRRGSIVVERNFAAVDAALAHLHEVPVPNSVTASQRRPPMVPDEAPDFVRRVTAVLLAGHGDRLPVSAFPVDGTWPTGTARWEKRNLGAEIPVWEPDVCIQCNQCALVCPHAAIRTKAYPPDSLTGAPPGFLAVPYKAPDLRGLLYTVQVAPEDCTGCYLCVEVCPAKDRANPRRKAINMAPQRPIRDRERHNYAFFLSLPELERTRVVRLDAKGSQFFEPLFEYSGACAGCGETPYIKLLTQLFGDRLLVANATGCSSIYGGNLPTTPYTTDAQGRGPAWSNSLFEDNAEFGFGFRLALDVQREQACHLLRSLAGQIGERLVKEILSNLENQRDEAGLAAQRERVAALRRRLAELDAPEARRLESVADALVRKSVWLVGGDGWAYDIGFAGLDHVLAQHRDVNVLVLDTEVYSNTGGQQSKATPLGAAAKFAAAGKEIPKKDIGLEIMAYGHVYVARVAFGPKINQPVQAILEADAYPGPSLVIAYSPCIAHGYDLRYGMAQQRLAVRSGAWPLYRFDPRRIAAGELPFQLDSPPPSVPLREYVANETRFRMVERLDPERFRRLLAAKERETAQRLAVYQQLAQMRVPASSG